MTINNNNIIKYNIIQLTNSNKHNNKNKINNINTENTIYTRR